VSFAHPIVALFALASLLLGALAMFASWAGAKAIRRFGDPSRMHALFTFDSGVRRAYKGVFLTLAVGLVFLAAARPQYGKGTRLIPATSLDVVVVLDYSKSMYARDVEPSRSFRAKVEVAHLIRELDGARFGAVAFAGDAISFPLTPDGIAIAQFFRGLEPNDMASGGTSIATALNEAGDLLRRDPKAIDHRRVILLVTDGEDLDDDPVPIARQIGAQGTTIHVVQIGGRTPEPIPEIGPDGKILGWRKDRQNRPMMTSLSAQGEAQLEAIAKATPGGTVVHAERGGTGIERVTTELKHQMKSELAEKVETVYADVYQYFLGAALLFLLMETFLGEAPRRKVVIPIPPSSTLARLSRRVVQAGGQAGGTDARPR
jgi:Ca-activated chloride channel family protein